MAPTHLEDRLGLLRAIRVLDLFDNATTAHDERLVQTREEGGLSLQSWGRRRNGDLKRRGSSKATGRTTKEVHEVPSELGLRGGVRRGRQCRVHRVVRDAHVALHPSLYKWWSG